VHTVPLNFHPRRIAHHASSRLIAVVGVEQIRPENAQLAPTGSGTNQYLLETSHIALCASPPSCDVLDRFALAPFEQGSAIMATSLPAHCNVSDMSAVFIVGTSFVYPDEEEPSKGRVLILGVNSQSRFQLLGEYNTQGAVFTVAEFGERLLCTINSRVQLLNFVVADQQLRLKPHAAHTGHILALYAKTFGDYILVGDLMKSMTLLVYRASVDASSESAIEEVARDLQSNWMTAVQFHGDSYLGAEQAGNMFVLRRAADAPTAEDRARLEECGRFHIGELINVFREGSLVMSASPSDAMEIDSEDFGTVRASQLFGTVHGMLGVVASLNATQFAFLSVLQTALQTRVRAIGNFSHSKYVHHCTHNCSYHNFYHSEFFSDGGNSETIIESNSRSTSSMAT
jgi:DNA damage-binding protein 1